ncbi:MAG: hypothetical protein ABII82_11495 [Verrucomicrobiota bacterium]
MRAKLDCIPCLCRETVNAARAATADPALQNAILSEALFHLAMREPADPPEVLADDLRSLIALRTGHDVPPLIQNPTCRHNG